MALPANRTWPPIGDSNPDKVFRVVVLPAPVVPMRVTTAPASTANEMPLTASILPYETRRSSTSNRAVIRAAPAGGRFLIRLRARVAGTTGGQHGRAPGGEGAPPGGTR